MILCAWLKVPILAVCVCLCSAGEPEGGSDAPAEEAGTEAGAPEGGPDDGGGGDPLLLEAPPEAQDTGAPPSKAVAVSYSRVSPRPSSGPLVPSSRAGSTASGCARMPAAWCWRLVMDASDHLGGFDRITPERARSSYIYMLLMRGGGLH